MNPQQAPNPPSAAPSPQAGPRLVLITAEGPDESAEVAPNQILGSEQRSVGMGGFCLTDR